VKCFITDKDKHSIDMKKERIEILQKVAKGELTPEQADGACGTMEYSFCCTHVLPDFKNKCK